jgi:hypothetical protein
VVLGDDVVDGDDGTDLNRSAGSVAQQARWERVGERNES